MAQYFPPRPQLTPWIYAYSNPAPAYKGLLKVGYTTRPSVEERIKEQFNVEQPEGLKPYRIEFKESAMRSDGSAFTDKDVHRLLEKSGFRECPAYTLLYQFSPKDTGQSKVK